MTTTPPPSSAIRTPPTPRYGSRYDNYEPYSPRRSKRIADQQHLFSGSAAALDASTTGLVKEHALRRDQELHQLNISGRATYSPPHSQVGSPKRRSERLDMNSPSLSPPPKNSRIRSEPVSSSVPHFSSSSSSHRSTMDANTNSSLAANGMLPTPAKTPRKKQIEDLGPTARTLFSSSSKSAQDPAAMMPKRSKKYSGFSLESFEADPQQASQEPIAIFTDSRDRIPQVNNSPDNPFRSKSADGEPSSKLSADAGKRRKLDESSRKRDKNVDKAIRRDDGLLYVFRGKKVFRKFKPDVEEEEEDDDDLGLLASRSELTSESIPRIRPLTRSSIKPRVLFPEARAAPVTREKEEPSTPSTIVEAEEEQGEEPDEEPVEGPTETADQPATAHAENESSENPITPEGQIIQTDTPSSPLASGRSLRSHGPKAGSGPEHCDPDTPTAKRISPFDRWRRGKSHSTPTKTKKRGIDGNSNQTSKKSRSH
ncbi:hypothetical protein GTR04_6371 [Trichophyton interdigitale]|nr:hypothetical protein GY631_6259 [Trichophyton interdigitale]KAG5217781.1 hypothetical protein GY632_6208 [Trichophyton interdigitale]KAG8206249.1 hypothetical protein GTR04_6371 [Trichophyton interdigitale]